MPAGLAGITGAFAIGVTIAALAAPPALEAARREFAAAVAAHDLNRIVRQSRFPVAVEMYGYPRSMSAKQFLFEKRRFTDLFGTLDEATVKCIATGLLAMQNDHKQFAYGSWYADCNGNEYFFSYQGGRWLFTGYENINE